MATWFGCVTISPHFLTLSPQFLGDYGSCEIAVFMKKKKKIKKFVDNTKIEYWSDDPTEQSVLFYPSYLQVLYVRQPNYVIFY